jgi:hypothetical protein
MNTDEKFNYYCEQMLKHAGERAMKRLETTMSQMLEMQRLPVMVWQYAEKEIAANKPKGKHEHDDN